MHWQDGLVVALYLAALVAIGLRTARRQTSTARYFVAERSIPGWAAGMSLLATIITSVTFIAYPGAAYAGDWNLLVPGIMFVVVVALIGQVIIPFFRRAVSMSVYEYFGQRFGLPVRMYASFAFALGHFSKMGFVFYLLALSVTGITGWPIGGIILVLGLITVLYTLIGGLEAVIWTDVLQGFVLWSGILVTILLLLFHSPCTSSQMIGAMIANNKMALGSMHFNLAKPTFWTLCLYGFFFYLQKYTADQTVVQRYLAARSDDQALRGINMGAWLCLPAWTAFMLIGSLLWTFYRLTAESLPSSITKPDQVFPHFMVTHMPIGLAGLFLAALFGAAMSMLASDLNCLAVILTEDFYAQFFPSHTDQRKLRVGKLSIGVCGLLAIGVALRLATISGSALSLYYTITAIVAGGLAGLFLLAFLSRRAGKTAAIAGIAVNLVFTTWATLTMNDGHIVNLHAWNYPWHEYTIGALGNVLLFGVGLIVALFSRSTPTGATLWSWLGREVLAKPETSQQGASE
ncbi:sodium:solute symporter [Telmatobacter bradus]|uniref:sodium:solute symporter n=1 Tax=Telmatobacter bradus TaxID=474953 RepID=UPI003B42BCC2